MAHENLEPRFMILPFRQGHRARSISRVDGTKGPANMKWETPEAIDFRFGMEITMYVSNR
jgi:coenzyme PQQ precursor peptide PqqA